MNGFQESDIEEMRERFDNIYESHIERGNRIGESYRIAAAKASFLHWEDDIEFPDWIFYGII